jgi:hypothetical protein
VTRAWLDDKIGHPGSFHVRMEWGEPVVLPDESDGGAVERGEVAITYLTPIGAELRTDERVTAALDRLVGATS